MVGASYMFVKWKGTVAALEDLESGEVFKQKEVSLRMKTATQENLKDSFNFFNYPPHQTKSGLPFKKQKQKQNFKAQTNLKKKIKAHLQS